MPAKNWMRSRTAASLMLLLFAFLAQMILPFPNAYAHRVYVYAWVDGDTVYTESYFGSKKKAQGGLIEVFDPSGKKLLEGRTNEEGEFNFKVPKKTDLRIVVEAGMGHRGEYILKAEEFAGIPVSKPDPVEKDPKKIEDPLKLTSDAQEIRSIIEQALDERLRPILRELAQSRKEKEPGSSEIIAGIGFIFGLMGLIMYFRSRRKK